MKKSDLESLFFMEQVLNQTGSQPITIKRYLLSNQKSSVLIHGAASTFSAPAISITSEAITACTSPA